MSLEEKPDTAQLEDVLVFLALKTREELAVLLQWVLPTNVWTIQKETPEESRYQKKHEVVPYNQRKPQLSVKKCKLQPTRKIEINWKDSNLPLCLKCVVKKGHLVIHLRTLKIYMLTKLNVVRQKFRKSKKNRSPSHNLRIEMQEDGIHIYKVMDDIRQSIKTESEFLKELDRAY